MARKIISNVITSLLFLTLLFMVFVVISSKASGGEPSFLGYQLKTVLSGSMEPTFQTGSVISVKPQEDYTKLKEGDIVTFMIDEQNVVTHRIINVVEKGEGVMYETKGDNNKDPDGNLLLPDNIVAKYTGFTIPYLGYLIDFAKSQKGTAALLITPGLLLLLYSGVTIFKAIKEIEITTKSSGRSDETEKTA
ncbi:signal peptidase I SipW [Rossellomorea vietnamensis]